MAEFGSAHKFASAEQVVIMANRATVLEGWREPTGAHRFSAELDVFAANSRCLTEAGLPMGLGLFNWRDGFDARQMVVEFVGDVIKETVMERLLHDQDVAANYCVAWDEPGEYLSCYGAFLAGRCWASFINSPFGARDDPTQRAAGVAQNLDVVANARMEAGYLRTDGEMRFSVQVWTTMVVRPGEELLMPYAAEEQGLYHHI